MVAPALCILVGALSTAPNAANPSSAHRAPASAEGIIVPAAQLREAKWTAADDRRVQRLQQGQPTRPPRRHTPVHRRVIGAAVGGLLGFYGGAFIGAGIEDGLSDHPDAGMLGAVIGAFTGAPLGAVFGAMATR